MIAGCFAPTPGRPRLAACAGPLHPAADEVPFLDAFEALARAAGAECEVFHSGIADPRDVPASMRRLVGTGVFAPQDVPIMECDLQHFRRTLPDELAGVLGSLAALTGRSDVHTNHDVLLAASHARCMRAFRADAVVSWSTRQPMVSAFVASRLLAIPHVMCLPHDWQESQYAPGVPFLAAHAAAVVADAADLARFAPQLDARAKTRLVPREQFASESMVQLLRAATAARAPDAPKLGPRAAFVTERRPEPARAGRIERYVVVGAERTGSNLLIDVLGAQPGVGTAGELFNTRSIARGTLQWLLDAGDPPPEVRAELRALLVDDPHGLHERLLRDAAAGGKQCVGFKLLYRHAAVDNRVADFLAADRAVRVVHLVRADRLRRLVSHLAARLTDTWFTGTGEPRAEVPRVELPVVALLEDFAYIEAMEQRYRALFHDHERIEIEYEDFNRDAAAVLARVGDLLGRRFAPAVPRLQRTGGKPLAQSVTNLAEVRDALVGTRWAHLVADA